MFRIFYAPQLQPQTPGFFICFSFEPSVFFSRPRTKNSTWRLNEKRCAFSSTKKEENKGGNVGIEKKRPATGRGGGGGGGGGGGVAVL